MSIWSEIRKQAQTWHHQLSGSESGLLPADDLLLAVEKETGIRRQILPANDILLDGGDAVYNPGQRCIYYSAATDPALARFHIAHEYAHHRLDAATSTCKGEDLDLTTPAEPEMSLVGEADAYSPKERAEAQANLFAREFLLPRQKLRQRCCTNKTDAEQIAAEVGLPLDLVLQQLADALLLPDDRDDKTNGAKKAIQPDPSQTAAIDALDTPLRVIAGPGTGKSSTLVHRAKKLIRDGVSPQSILILTFSNFSAEDLESRLRKTLESKSPGVWVGTFHSYGLELLRKYSVEAGFSKQPRLLDRTGSLMLLEELLPDLHLDHYLDLVDPIRGLRAVLSLISRAKDEVASPSQYEACARAMTVDPVQSVREEGEKALEIARAYEIYNQTLRARDLVDFGDLIVRPIELFQAEPAIRDQVRERHPHILVDEYQDMNRASSVLLRELVTPGKGPWVVGDIQQSIYRFRGASPANMTMFPRDFPGAARTPLGVNYRSFGPIIRAFEAFAADMTVGDTASSKHLEAHRGDGTGRICFDVAATFPCECEGIAQTLWSAVREGGRYSDHAILARSHTTLARLAKHLERCGIPCLYFGDFFERPEIRDLLSVLSVVSERAGIGLFRVAQLPPYNAAPDDILTVVRWRTEQGISVLSALRRLDEIGDLSPAGRTALHRLADDLRDVDYVTRPHSFLLRFLFLRSHSIEDLVEDLSVKGQQRRLAIYQFLQFAFAYRSASQGDPKQLLLDHVRRLEILDEEKELRRLPAAARDIEAVIAMTVHASKGLEFPVVHVPSVTSRHFPINRADANVLPKGLLTPDPLMTREAEEESLFFVAMSRAKDALHLSRAVSYGGGAWSNVKPSPFLERLKGHLPKSPNVPPNWTLVGPSEPDEPLLFPPHDRESWPAKAIETYIECPRRFYYDEVLQLGAYELSSPYLQFQSALHKTMAWLRQTASQKERQEGILARFSEDWSRTGPHSHPFESIYRATAQQMLVTAISLMEKSSLPVEFSIKSGKVLVTCRADHVSAGSGEVVIRRFKAGKLATSGEKPRLRYAVMLEAARTLYPGAAVQLEHVSLISGDRQAMKMNPQKLAGELVKIQEAFQNIAAGRFDPTPSDFNCPRCPYFFICPSRGPAQAGKK